MMKSKSDMFMENKNSSLPQISSNVGNSVSQQRKEMLTQDIISGIYREGSETRMNGMTKNSNVTASVGFKKQAQVISGGGGFRGGSGDTVKQGPEVYSPLWLNSNLSLPRDRVTINAWCRAFFALNPFVQNAISLHSTYPISKLNIKCPNKEIEKFFNDMIEETDLMNVCVQIAQEYWLLGEAFVYAELDEREAKWSHFVIQNPDYMVLKPTVRDPVIMMRADENLTRIVKSNKPADIAQRKQLNQHIIDSVNKGGMIPLDNFNVSHLARKIAPYETRGTGLPVCIFRQLCLFDKLRECYSSDTEVLTDQGFKLISDLVHETTSLSVNPEYVNGTFTDENGEITSVLVLKDNVKVACYNSDSDEIEYHVPKELHMSKYNGDMIHFSGQKVDTLVSPNHKMWVKEQTNGKYGEYSKVPAAKMLDKKKFWKFKSKAKFVSDKKPEFFEICDKKIPTDLYLKVLGYIVSEGCIYENFENNRYDAVVHLTQLTSSDCYEDMRSSFNEFASYFDKNVSETIKVCGSGFSENNSKEKWEGRIHGKNLTNFFKKEIGINNSTLSKDKHLPRYVMDLHPDLLNILLKSLVFGDGSEKINNDYTSFRYSTISKQLADDVYELVYKTGFVPNICVSKRIIEDKELTEYIVLWSSSKVGNEPTVATFNSKNRCGALSKKINYDGIVWCFEVPTGLFITRRNGKITIQGNSKYAQADNMVNPLTLIKIGGEGADGQHPTPADLEAWRSVFEEAQYDKDFKVFTHPGVTVEKIGSGAGIYDISGDITQLVKEIYVGLQVPSVLMDGGADTSYANGGVALDVLRQRYMQFRNMLSSWLKRKVFAPISKLNNFYDYSGGEKQLIVPEIDWNHMSLFDAGDYITNLVNLTTGESGAKRVSVHTLYRSLGLEFEDEARKMRKEAIQAAIQMKEKAALDGMDLNALRSLDEEDEIPDLPKDESKLPGEAGANPAEPPLPGQEPPSLDMSTPPGGS